MSNARNLSKLKPDTSGLIQANDLNGQQSGSAPIFGARAWVKFVGSTGAILGSGNVSGVSRSSTGVYTITFATAMPDTNYAVVGLGADTGATGPGLLSRVTASTTDVLINIVSLAGTVIDRGVVCVAIYG